MYRWVVPPGRRVDASMDLSPLRFYRKPIEVTISSANSAEMRFPTTTNVGANVGGFRPTDGSEGHGGDSFDARYREHLGDITRVVDLDYDEGGSLG